MGNLFSNIKFIQPIECCVCKIKRSHYGNNYLAYIIGQGKYNNRYYCLNCLSLLINKRELLMIKGKNL